MSPHALEIRGLTKSFTRFRLGPLDVTVPAGMLLTIESNTWVILEGVTAGTTAADLLVNGTIQSLGTEQHPVTITCASTNPAARWGQIRHNNAQPSLYRFTSINRAGRGTGEGHYPWSEPGSKLHFNVFH